MRNPLSFLWPLNTYVTEALFPWMDRRRACWAPWPKTHHYGSAGYVQISFKHSHLLGNTDKTQDTATPRDWLLFVLLYVKQNNGGGGGQDGLHCYWQLDWNSLGWCKYYWEAYLLGCCVQLCIIYLFALLLFLFLQKCLIVNRPFGKQKGSTMIILKVSSFGLLYTACLYLHFFCNVMWIPKVVLYIFGLNPMHTVK